ncbi:MAG TPA: transcriptional regulator [Clostridiales bacterium]|nr:MAG: transcriptional regulator [Clostridiales bacterium GWD2_32_59]HAN09786.1 transcriptional regulator [Clostridiales bacterium]
MDKNELIELLNEFRSLPAENEWLEFKEAKENYDFSKLGKYFSSISNEANLKGKRYGWLIFGVTDKTKEVVGTNYRSEEASLDKLKREVAIKTNNGTTFMEIYEVEVEGKRVIMFQIPAALNGMPTSWEGHFYGRDNESQVPLSTIEYEEIRNQAGKDFTGEICEEATINDIDTNAIKKAREEYKVKNPKQAQEVDGWNDVTFLNKAKVLKNGKITYAALILLGKEESEYLLDSYVAKITWILKDENNIEKDYEHFTIPFILTGDKVYDKIRNLNYRYIPSQTTLFPLEVKQYEPYIIREALNNCIAHQDYQARGKINVVEKSDELIFSNLGSFIPGTIENVIKNNAPTEYYRNKFLANAMVNLNMIDTIGSGIRKMFTIQAKRFFPMPYYDLQENGRVVLSISGKIIDENYSRLLFNNDELDLETIFLLDKVQRGRKITKEQSDYLRKDGFIEGRYPNVFVSSKIAEITDHKEKYIKNRGFDKQYYKDLVIEYLKEYNQASRANINGLLMDKLPDVLTDLQKKKKISNILYEMNGIKIKNVGTRQNPIWKLA